MVHFCDGGAVTLVGRNRTAAQGGRREETAEEETGRWRGQVQRRRGLQEGDRQRQVGDRASNIVT